MTERDGVMYDDDGQMVCRATPAEELQAAFLASLKAIGEYWASAELGAERDNVSERIMGALFSGLVLIDGGSGDFPCGFDLVASVHPDDKKFYQDEEVDWIEPGTVINESVPLHELFVREN